MHAQMSLTLDLRGETVQTLLNHSGWIIVVIPIYTICWILHCVTVMSLWQFSVKIIVLKSLLPKISLVALGQAFCLV